MYTRTLLTLLLGLVANFAAVGAEPQPGLLVRLYDIGEEVRWLPELLAGQLPNAVKVVPSLDLNTKHRDFGEMENNFLTEVVGQIKIEQPGKYTLRLISDDGAQLWLDGRLLIDNDGAHAAAPKDGEIELSPGQHELRIWHFQAGGGGQLTLQWRPPVAADPRVGRSEPGAAATGQVAAGVSPAEADFALIPATLLSHSGDAPNETAPGKKKFIPPLRRGRPGDGTPLAGRHPSLGGSHSDQLTLSIEPAPHRNAVALDLVAGLELCALGSTEKRAGPVIWLPWEASTAALSDPAGVGSALVVANAATGSLVRVFFDQRGKTMQGCAMRFSEGLPVGLREISRDQSMFTQVTGRVRDPRTGVEQTVELERWSARGRATFEMLAVRVRKNGFEIEFGMPLDPRVGWDPESYYVEQWPFDVHKGIPPHRDGLIYTVKSASVSPDRRKVFVEIDDLKASHLVYIRLLPPCLSESGKLPWATEVWYTLNDMPAIQPGKVLSPPPKEPQNLLTDEEKQAGWRLLFDGQTAKGWHTYRNRDAKTPTPALPLEGGGSQALRGWQVIDGCLVRVGPGGDIVTDDQFGDFELAFEWRISPGGNSGVIYRVTEDRDYPWRTGPEYQILDNTEHADGRSPLTSAGSCYALYAPVKDVTQPIGLFNKSRLVIHGQHVEHWLNGVKVVEYELGSPEWEKLVKESKFGQMPDYGRRAKGKLCLQDHGDKVWYRNIKVRTVPGGKTEP